MIYKPSDYGENYDDSCTSERSALLAKTPSMRKARYYFFFFSNSSAKTKARTRRVLALGVARMMAVTNLSEKE